MGNRLRPRKPKVRPGDPAPRDVLAGWKRRVQDLPAPWEGGVFGALEWGRLARLGASHEGRAPHHARPKLLSDLHADAAKLRGDDLARAPGEIPGARPTRRDAPLPLQESPWR